MAITVRSSNGIIEHLQNATAVTSHTINLSDAAVGDLRILMIAFGPDGTGTIPSAPTISGWSQAITSLNTGAASDTRLSVFYRIVQGGDTLTSATLAITTNQICMTASLAVTLEGIDTSTPLDQTSPSPATGQHPIDSPSITTQTDGAWVFSLGIQDGTTGALVDGNVPTNYTLIGTIANGSPSNGINIGAGYREIATAGAENPPAWGTNTGTEEVVEATFAIRAAPEGITGVTPDEFDMDNADVDIESSGDVFDASGNDVYISDADTLAGSVNEVDISSAINTEAIGLINLDLTQLSAGELDDLHTLGPGARYIIVDAVGGEYSFPITLHRPEAFRMSLGAGTPGVTTARLDPPGIKTTGDFTPGRFEEAANPTSAVDIVADEYTELVWSIEAKILSREEIYDFRVTVGGVVIDTYIVTPQVTVTAGITLVVDDSSHTHVVENVEVTQAFTLVTQDAAHGHAVENVALVQAHTVQSEDTTHAHFAEEPVLSIILVSNDSSHAHAAGVPFLTQVNKIQSHYLGHDHFADEPILTQAHLLSTNDTLHGHVSDEPVLTTNIVIAPDNATHSHVADNVILLQSYTLVVADSSHGHAVDNPNLTQQNTLAVANANHSHSANEPALIQSNVLSANDSLHSHTAENVVLVQNNILISQGSSHSHIVDEPILIQSNVLSADDSSHGHAAPNLSLTQNNQLAPEDSVHAHASEVPDLTQANTLASQDSLHGHTAENVDLSTADSLNPQKSTHAHAVDGVVLTQNNVLASNDTLHGHTAENVVLQPSIDLVVANSLHTHTAGEPVLQLAIELVVANSLHSHAVDNVVLIQGYVLVSENTLHAHAAENVVLLAGVNLSVQNSLHSHAVEVPTLTQENILVSQNALHTHTVDNVVVSVASVLLVQNSLHSHTTEEPTVTIKFTLSVGNAIHVHSVDSVLLTQSHLLITNDTLHTHLAENVILITPVLLEVQDTHHGLTSESVLLIVLSIKIVTIVGRFKTGESVNVTVYDLSDNSVVIDDVAMTEILTLGYFKYKYEELTDHQKEFFYIMDNGVFEQSGRLNFLDQELVGTQIPLPPSSTENVEEVWRAVAADYLDADTMGEMMDEILKKSKLAAFKL